MWKRDDAVKPTATGASPGPAPAHPVDVPHAQTRHRPDGRAPATLSVDRRKLL